MILAAPTGQEYEFDGITSGCRSEIHHFPALLLVSGSYIQVSVCSHGMPTVSIIQRRLTHYRVPLFERMRDQLQQHGIRLRLLHGTGTEQEQSKKDTGTLSWAEPLATRYLLGGRICWQPFMAQAQGSDLIVVTQENKLVHNLPLLYSRRRKGPMLAFWGHGKNMQSARPDGWLERFKQDQTCRVDWWFAYTDLSASFVRNAGFAGERITTVNNTVDTRELSLALAEARTKPLQERRASMGLGSGPIGVFLGSIYPGKRVNFLIEAVSRIRLQIPSFELLVVGDGPQFEESRALASALPCVRFTGSARGATKASLLSCADVMLNPGLLGLVVLDSFVAGTPIVCCRQSLDAPESHYVHHGWNGLIAEDDLDSFVEATTALLLDEPRLKALARHAEESAHMYSLEEMSRRYCDGISRALEAGPM